MPEKIQGAYVGAQAKQEDNSLSLQKIIGIVISWWPWFAVSLFCSLAMAFFLLRYSTPTYKTNATILINDDQKAGEGGNMEILQNLGILSGRSNVDNEVGIFKSRSLMESVVRDMQLNVHYYSLGKVKASPLYENIPFRCSFVPLNEDSLLHVTYKIKLSLLGGDRFNYKCEGDRFNELSGTAKWGDTLQLPIGKLVAEPTGQPITDVTDYLVKVRSTDKTVQDYMKALTAVVSNKQVTMIDLTLQEDGPRKGEDVLNRLIQFYIKANVEDRNKITDSTIRFIDERMVLVGQELAGIEKEIEDFKKTNQLTDLGEQSKLLLDNSSDYLKQLTQSEVQLSIVSSLESYLRENANNRRVVPSSLVVQNPTFTGIVEKYNGLQLERQRLLMSTTADNPIVKNLDIQLDDLRADLSHSLITVKRELEVSVRELRRRTGGLEEQIRGVPTKERLFLEYSRQQNVKQALYLYLLQKREETAINKSSTLANVRIIDPAKSDADPFKPKRSVAFLTAFLLGVIIPSIAVYIISLLNTRVESKKEVIEKTNVAVVGEIGHNPMEQDIVMTATSRDRLSEQFRALRTNVQFLLRGSQRKVIMLTSSMSGEGKSFTAINLAFSLALTGKKVVLLDLDLRKPKLGQKLNLDSHNGFSSYVIGQSELSDVIQSSGIHPGLSVITAGPVPPNPAELLMLPDVKELFDLLKGSFDYIVVDTAPIGLVTDAQILDHVVDTSLYIVRQGVTFKQQLGFISELHKERKLPQLNIVINDVKTGRGYGYNYALGQYVYGEYAGYYDEPAAKKGLLKRMKKVRSKQNELQ